MFERTPPKLRAICGMLLFSGFSIACSDPAAPYGQIGRLLILTNTEMGRIVQADAVSAEVREVETALPRFECGATADLSERIFFAGRRRSHAEVGFSLFKVDADTGRILETRTFAELAHGAGTAEGEPVLDCPMVSAGQRLYLPLARTSRGYVLVGVDSKDLDIVQVLEPAPVVPFALATTGPLPGFPKGGLLVLGFPLDTGGQSVAGAGRLVGFDLESGARIPDLDLDYDAPWGTSGFIVDRDASVAYLVAYPALLRVSLASPHDITNEPARVAGPLALARGSLWQAAIGLTIEQPGNGKVYRYDLSGVLSDSVDVWPPEDKQPPFVTELMPDSSNDRLFIHVGTGSGGLYHDLQLARVLVIDVDRRVMVRNIALNVWSAGRILPFF